MVQKLDEHFSPEFEPVILPLALLAQPVEGQPSYRFGGNDFFLMRGLQQPTRKRTVVNGKTRLIDVPPPPRIAQTTPLSKVLFEVLASADKVRSDHRYQTRMFFEAEEAAINRLKQQAMQKAVASVPARAEINTVFRQFDDFMDARHGVDFADLVRRTHTFGRAVVFRAQSYVTALAADSPEENHNRPPDLSTAV